MAPHLRRPKTRTPLAGKSVLITGAARGIGAELARKAAARGARVALVGLEPELLAAVADELGPEHLWLETDVTDADALKAAVQRTVDTFGGLDIVVANAGIAPLTTVFTASAQSLSRTIEVNPQLEADIAKLDGRQFGKNSVGAQPKKNPAA